MAQIKFVYPYVICVERVQGISYHAFANQPKSHRIPVAKICLGTEFLTVRGGQILDYLTPYKPYH